MLIMLFSLLLMDGERTALASTPSLVSMDFKGRRGHVIISLHVLPLASIALSLLFRISLTNY